MIELKLLGIQRDTKANAKIKTHIREINKLYNNGLSLSKISVSLDIDRKALARLFKNNGLETRAGFSYARKHIILDEHYFDVIDTEEKAYLLGFIYADGNNFKGTNRIRIELNSKDRDILERVSNIIYGQDILSERSRTNNKGEIFYYTAIDIHSQHISETLEKHGVVERKSKVIEFPKWLNKSLYRHFIRGLIDGDGCISIPQKESPCVILISTTKMNDFIKDYIKKELDIRSYRLKAYKQNIDEMYYLKIKNYAQVKKLLDWYYDSATIYLERKFQLYQTILEKYNELPEWRITNPGGHPRHDAEREQSQGA
jgi:intein/homing endonuclease